MENVEKVKSLLGGYNCGACGRVDCEAMAKDICSKRGRPEECLPIDPDNISKIKEIVK